MPRCPANADQEHATAEPVPRRRDRSRVDVCCCSCTLLGLCTASGFCQRSNNMHLGVTFLTPNIPMTGLHLQSQGIFITVDSKRKKHHTRKQRSCPRFRGTAQGHCTGFSGPGAIGASCMWSLMCYRSGLWDTYSATKSVHMQLQHALASLRKHAALLKRLC